MILTIGKATQAAWNKPGYLDNSEIFVTDKFTA